MNKGMKGVLAAGGAGLLMFGGAGSLALWSDTETITGGAINTGHIGLVTDGTNVGCGGWELDGGELPATTYTVGDPLVPGDVLTRQCAFTIDVLGNHMRATIGLSAPNFSGIDGDLLGTLTADVSDLRVAGILVSEITDADDGLTMAATITVTFDSLAGNSTQDLATVLDSITLTASQVHA